MTAHRWRIRVYYEDTDLAGLVYYANYLRFIERARSEMVREAGIDQAALREAGQVFAVTRVVADYLQPARYDDELIVTTTVQRMTPARLILSQEVSRGETALFKADVSLAFLDMTGRPRRMPQDLCSRLQRIAVA
ncbi:tol-pal system-associated acyl-CoA thioesterase [Jannaschia sp. 2305UL9-9]|uniref:tol-pal system-associated acyl-CoA thioesterase n=1 Tax=Jannaschia sp. 2305UL9-9 TaxID=3121638 RepID=UPI00352973B2